MEKLEGNKQRNSGSDTTLTVFHRLAPVSPDWAILFWFLVAIISMAVAYVISVDIDSDQYPFRALCIYQAAGLVAVPLAIDTGLRILRNWAIRLDSFAVQEDSFVSDWFLKELEFVKGDLTMLLAGISLGTLGVAAFYYGDYFSSYSGIPLIFVCLIIFVSASFAGTGLYMMFCVSRTFWRLGKLTRITFTVHNHRFGIMSVGAVLVKCWMIIGCIWAIYVASAFVGFQGEDFEIVFSKPPMWLIAYPTFPLILGSFIVCQYPLHQKMIEYKRTEILRLEKMRDQIKPQNISEIDNELRSNIDFLDKQKEQYRSLPEWPFSLVSLLGTGASSVTALFPALIMDGVPDWILKLLNN